MECGRVLSIQSAIQAPRDRLAGAVAAGGAHENGHHGPAAKEPPRLHFGAQVLQELFLNGVGAILVLERAAFLPPRIGSEDKPQRVRIVLRHFMREFRGGARHLHD